MSNAERTRVVEALEAALRVGQGRVNVYVVAERDEPTPPLPSPWKGEGAPPPSAPPPRERGGSASPSPALLLAGEGAPPPPRPSPEQGEGVFASRIAPAPAWRFSSSLHCPDCDIHTASPLPSLFSFNSPLGACETCRGFGRVIGIDFGLIIPDESKTLREGAIKPWQTPSFSECQDDMKKYAPKRGVPWTCRGATWTRSTSAGCGGR